MGMFDTTKNFTDHFREGENFRLVAAHVERRNTAEYGEQEMAVLTIEKDDERGKYGLFGVGVVAQVQRQAPDDLPATVSIQRGRNKAGQALKLLVPQGMTVEAVQGQQQEQANGARVTPVGDDTDDIPF